ncbi:PREDICTED: uncharacterized protein LOC104818236 [Tarenaya hassleriana]|uniref:uncharacterized protein LOC104818236 n=1 Tax=Tarenaya hassleriana TaxID=28532 RepID=UPI00053C308B|nr:PREDICTED: uncharacterized protein LOC104818236 [Tarenaya hassleriana]
MQTSRLLSHSPSFGSSSAGVDLAAIAVRVVEEFRGHELQSDSHADEFEFAFACDHRHSDPIATADEIFCNGQIRPSNPYALLTCSAVGAGSPTDAKAEDGSSPPITLRRRRPPLRKLMSEERDSAPTATCSPKSSEADEDLIGVSPDTYCVWTPKYPTGDERLHEQSSSPSQGEIKSSNGGISKRWKLRSLLYARSTSDGKEKFVIMTPVKKTERSNAGEEKPSPLDGKCDGENSYCERSEEPKRRAYVPYRKDMVGILRNAYG